MAAFVGGAIQGASPRIDVYKRQLVGQKPEFVALYHKRRALSQGKANRYCICTKMTTACMESLKDASLPADYAGVKNV